MPRNVIITTENFPIAGTFTISRGAKTSAEVVTCTITDGDHTGRGECVPYKRYGETLESVNQQIAQAKGAIESGCTRQGLLTLMQPGAARNAVDCALFDLEAKISGRSAWKDICATLPAPLLTAYTISLGEPETMAAQARDWSHRALLKVKVGTSDDASRIAAVRDAAPNSTLILDANEGWTDENIAYHLDICARSGVTLVEQPLPAGKDAILAGIDHRVTICADESVHDRTTLAALRDRYDAVNIKLDKTGGLTEALLLKQDAQKLGFRIMVGCMVGTSLAMAPAVLLAQDADFVDLDGPLLLAKDRDNGLIYAGSTVLPPEPSLWG
jgi:L-Ala-D/L-Glu epimerase